MSGSWAPSSDEGRPNREPFHLKTPHCIVLFTVGLVCVATPRIAGQSSEVVKVAGLEETLTLRHGFDAKIAVRSARNFAGYTCLIPSLGILDLH